MDSAGVEAHVDGEHQKSCGLSKFSKKSLGEPTIDYVGIAADEPTRFNKASQEGKTLPLVQWGMTEKDCLQYCYDRGFTGLKKQPMQAQRILTSTLFWIEYRAGVAVIKI